jgi:hypothetical protein
MMAFTLFFILMKKVYLMPPRIKDLQIFRFLRNGKAACFNLNKMLRLKIHYLKLKRNMARSAILKYSQVNII